MTSHESSVIDISRVNDVVDTYNDPILWVVTARSGQQRGGLIATFVSKASLVPDMPRLVVGIANHHHTWKLIDDSYALGLHIVCQDQLHWIQQFGLQSGNDGVDKFEAIPTETGPTGSPILLDTLLWMDCRVESSLNTGDRTLYLAEVLTAGSHRQGEPARLTETMARLTVEQRAECQRQLARDILIDAAAIHARRA